MNDLHGTQPGQKTSCLADLQLPSSAVTLFLKGYTPSVYAFQNTFQEVWSWDAVKALTQDKHYVGQGL